jgi:uncharacterized protein (TIGR02266 family)
VSGDARRSDRVPVALPVRYASAGAFLVAYTTNLSKGGIFLETATPLPPGTSLTLAITVPHAPETLVVAGRVAWARQAPGPEGQPPGMGIEFGPLEERYGAAIDEIVARFDGVRILVVSTLPTVRGAVLRYLKTIIAAQVAEADGAAAAARALAGRVDLCIVDLDDGPEGEATLRAARDHAEHPVPVIALGREAEARARGAASRADEVLVSPPVFAELQAAVIRCLAKPLAIS